MNLTITQAIERTKDLSGELKAARTAKADCAADVEAKDRLAEIARKALSNAEEHEVRLLVEREDLAEHIASLVRQTGEALVLDPPEPTVNPADCTDHGRAIYSVGLEDYCHDCGSRYVPGYNAERALPDNAALQAGFHRALDEGGIAAADAFVEEHKAYNSIFTEGADFQAQALQNGIDRIGEALDAART